ncbi:sigma factor-like helix-turn-helix DNA-binding protein [Bacillus sp. FSL W7-1360]
MRRKVDKLLQECRENLDLLDQKDMPHISEIFEFDWTEEQIASAVQQGILSEEQCIQISNLLKALNKLPQQERKLFFLRNFQREKITVQQIAQNFSISHRHYHRIKGEALDELARLLRLEKQLVFSK